MSLPNDMNTTNSLVLIYIRPYITHFDGKNHTWFWNWAAPPKSKFNPIKIQSIKPNMTSSIKEFLFLFSWCGASLAQGKRWKTFVTNFDFISYLATKYDKQPGKYNTPTTSIMIW